MRRFLDLFWTLVKLLIIAGVVALGSCTTARTILKQAPTELPRNWTADQRTPLPEAQARALLQSELYGRLGTDLRVTESDFQLIDGLALGGKATLAQWRVMLGNEAISLPLDIAILLPNGSSKAPLILSQNFCPNNNVLPFDGVRAPETTDFDCSGGGIFRSLMKSVFGRYIVTPPAEDIIDRGYALAVMFPSQFVPDRAEAGLAALDALFPDEANRPGALSVWSQLFPIAANLIEAEYGERHTVAYGHSRFGKTALLAGAWSDEIDAVIAHQSGTLGASAIDDKDGEPLGALIEVYPHWAGNGAARYAGRAGSVPVKPSDLLALLGDKPVLLGNARRDVWSDPWGAFKEGKTAWGDAFSAQDPSDFRPADNKAYWLRPGTHGVVKEDWPAFLDFLDANIGNQTN